MCEQNKIETRRRNIFLYRYSYTEFKTNHLSYLKGFSDSSKKSDVPLTYGQFKKKSFYPVALSKTANCGTLAMILCFTGEQRKALGERDESARSETYASRGAWLKKKSARRCLALYAFIRLPLRLKKIKLAPIPQDSSTLTSGSRIQHIETYYLKNKEAWTVICFVVRHA